VENDGFRLSFGDRKNNKKEQKDEEEKKETKRNCF